MSNHVEIALAMAANGCTGDQIAGTLAMLSRTEKALSGAERTARYRDRKDMPRDVPIVTVTDVTIKPSHSVTVTGDPRAPAPTPAFCTGEEVVIPLSETTSLRSPKIAKPEKRLCRLPEDWEPLDSHFSRGASLGLSRAQVMDLGEEFKNFWISDGRKKLDWNRAFTNRIIDQAPRILARSRSPPLNGHAIVKQSTARALMEMSRGKSNPSPGSLFDGESDAASAKPPIDGEFVEIA